MHKTSFQVKKKEAEKKYHKIAADKAMTDLHSTSAVHSGLFLAPVGVEIGLCVVLLSWICHISKVSVFFSQPHTFTAILPALCKETKMQRFGRPVTL